MAGDSKLTQTFTTDDSKLLASYEKILRKTEDVLNASRRLAQESKKQSADVQKGMQDQAAASDRLTGALTGIVGQVGRIAAGYVSAQAAVKLFSAEVERTITMQEKAAAAFTGLASPTTSMRVNLGDISPADYKKVEDRIEQMAMKGLGKVGDLRNAFGALTSASPNLKVGERLDVLETAAKIAPEGQLQEVAEGLADTTKLTKTADAATNVGVLVSTQKLSRATSTTDVAKNTMPAVASFTEGYGGTQAENLALFNALQNRAGDRKGEMTATAFTGFGEQLKQYFDPEQIRQREANRLTREGSLAWSEKPDESLRNSFGEFMVREMPQAKGHSFEEQLEVFKSDQALQQKWFDQRQAEMAQAATPAQRIGYLQAHPAESAEFQKLYHGEQKFIQPVRELVGNAESQVSQNFAEWSPQLPTGEAAARAGQAKIEEVGNDKYVKARRTELGLENAADQMRRVKEGAVEGGISRKALKDILQASDINWPEEKLKELHFEASTGFGRHGAYDELRGALVQRKNELRYRTAGMFEAEPEGGYRFATVGDNGQFMTEAQLKASGGVPGRALVPNEDPEALKQADIIEQSIEQLDAMRRTPAPGWRGSSAPLEGAFGLSQDAYEAAAVGFDQTGGLRKHGIDDEFEMLRRGQGAETFAGHEADLEKLDLMTTGQIQHERETSNNPEMLATLKGIHDGIQGMLAELKDVKKETAAAKDATKNAASENRAANRSAGARAQAASGRE